jgi:hypothetical protein
MMMGSSVLNYFKSKQFLERMDLENQDFADDESSERRQTQNLTFLRTNNKYTRQGYSEEMSEGRLTNLQFDAFLTQVENHVDDFFYETLCTYLHIIIVISISLIGLYCVIVKIIFAGKSQDKEIQAMVTRTVFLFVCWVLNWLVKNFYLPKHY